MLEERDAKIRELEATIKALQEKLGACDNSEKISTNKMDGDNVLENNKPDFVQTLNANEQEVNNESEHDDNLTQ